jgi:hypothetical protein
LEIVQNSRCSFQNKPGSLKIALIHVSKASSPLIPAMPKKRNYSAALTQNLKVAREEKARKHRRSTEPNSTEIQGASSVTAEYNGRIRERGPYRDD